MPCPSPRIDRRNGQAVSARVDPRLLPADFLRVSSSASTGTHIGCDTAAVRRLHRAPRRPRDRSCNVLAAQAQRRGRSLTIEGSPPPTGRCIRCRRRFTRAPRPAVRLLYTGHGDEPRSTSSRDDPGRRPSDGDPRRARRQPLPLHRLPQHRQGGGAWCRRNGETGETISRAAARSAAPKGRRCSRRPANLTTYRFIQPGSDTEVFAPMGANETGYIGQVGPPQGGRLASRPVPGQYTDDGTMPHQTQAFFLRSRRTRTRESAGSTPRRRRRRRRSRRDLHGCRPRGRERPAVRKVGSHHERGRNADEAKPPHHVLAKGKVRQRSATVVALRRRRDAGAGEGCGRSRSVVDYEVLPCGRSIRAEAQARARRRSTTMRPDNTIYQLARSATRRRSTAAFARRPSTSPGSTSSTTGWCRTRSSRAPRSREYDDAAPSSFTLYEHDAEPACRAPGACRRFVGIAPEHKLRVIAPDVGGGFGSEDLHLSGRGGVRSGRRRRSAVR